MEQTNKGITELDNKMNELNINSLESNSKLLQLIEDEESEKNENKGDNTKSI